MRAKLGITDLDDGKSPVLDMGGRHLEKMLTPEQIVDDMQWF